jgi:hypothetical protein
MATYTLVDSQNLFFRCRHGIAAPKSFVGDLEQQLALSLHVIISSVKKVFDQFDSNHTVFCLEGKSWRKSIYPRYKANRKITLLQRTEQEIIDDEKFFDTMDKFTQFLTKQTNCTVLRSPDGEADDMIARWIALHPNDQHIVISSDSDFQQLVSENVKIYNGIVGLLYTHTGIYDKDGNIAKNKQGKDMPIPDPEWILFEKCIRGDPGDNVMSSFPGVRTTKLAEAFKDRHYKGFAWNNLMLSKWVDPDGVEHRVKDDYERNRILVDLGSQPADLQEKFDQSIIDSIILENKKQVGFALMHFCKIHGLVQIEKYVKDYSKCFSLPYTGHLKQKQEE